MEKKWIIITVIAVAVVAIAAAAAVLMMNGDKEWETSPDKWVLDHSISVGDWIEFDGTEYEITGKTGDKYDVRVSKGYSSSYKEMTSKEFLSLLTSKKQLEAWTDGFDIDYNLKYDSTRDISTEFGTKTCKVYKGTATGSLLGSKITQNLSLYIGDHGILYRMDTDSGNLYLDSNLSFL